MNLLQFSQTYPFASAHGLAGPWPTPDQRLLLRAVLDEEDSALDAWNTWLAGHNLDLHGDYASWILLPLLFRRLERLSSRRDLPELGRLRGIYRYCWSKNQAVLMSLSRALAAFEAGGIRVIALKGLPLIERYYRDWGVRRTHDLDLLIDLSDLDRAHGRLLVSGWRAIEPLPEPAQRPFKHALAYQREPGLELDLHWRPYMLDTPPAAEAALWARAETYEVLGRKLLAPDALDMLLLSIYHGRKSAADASCRWVVDAVTQIRAVPGLDWNELLRRARAAGLHEPLREGLEYLKSEMGIAVPVALPAYGSSRRARLFWKLRCRSHEAIRTQRPWRSDLLRPLRSLMFHWLRYSFVAQARSEPQPLRGFLRYLRTLRLARAMAAPTSDSAPVPQHAG
jgi:hypothetical protein